MRALNISQPAKWVKARFGLWFVGPVDGAEWKLWHVCFTLTQGRIETQKGEEEVALFPEAKRLQVVYLQNRMILL